MHEIPRPVTKDFFMHEEYSLPHAEEAIAEFQETGKPVVLWWDEWSEVSASARTIHMTSYERDQAMQQVFELCGIKDGFHSNIRLLKKPDIGSRGDITWVNETTFGEHKPSLTDIFQWLGDQNDFWADEPNDFNVGILLDSPVGLVVVKFNSVEPFEDGDDIEISTQIALYPKDAINDLKSIYWSADRYNPRA